MSTATYSNKRLIFALEEVTGEQGTREYVFELTVEYICRVFRCMYVGQLVN